MDKAEFSLYEYLLVLKKHQRLALTVFLGTILITAFFAFRTPNIWQAETTFYYPLSDKGDSLGNAAQSVLGKEGSGLVSALLPSGGSSMQNYTKGILESRKVAEILNNQMHLKERLHLGRDSDAVGVIRGSSQIRLSPEGIMSVTVRTGNPQLSADIANGYVEAFREFSLNSMVSNSKKHRIDVQIRIKQLQDKLHQAEADMMAFQLKHKAADFVEEEKLLMHTLDELRDEDLSSQIALEATRGSLNRVMGIARNQIRMATREPLVSPNFADPVLANLKDQLAEVYVKYSQAKLTQTGANPELRSLQAQVKNLESSIREALRRQLAAQNSGVSDDFLNLRIKIAQLHAKQDALRSGIKKLESRFIRYPATGIQYLRLERRLKILEALDGFLATEYEKARLEESRESPDFQVLDKAVPPEFKIGPHRLFNLLIGFFLGAFLGVAAAFSLESIQRPTQLLRETDGHVKDDELELADKLTRT